MAGLFITFEGIEGSGKTTQIKLLAKILKKKGFEVVLTREPGGTKLANQIRRLLLDRKYKGMPSMTELFLYEASRAAHVSEVIEPALKRKAVVLCDRFTDATLAYQGYARGLSIPLLKKLNDLATQSSKPDLTILLDCPHDQGLKRARARNAEHQSVQDRFEQESLKFHKRVRQGYLKIMSQNKKRFFKVNTHLSPEVVHQQILKKVLESLS